MKNPDVIWLSEESGEPEYFIIEDKSFKSTYRNQYEYFLINKEEKIIKYKLVKEENADQSK